MEKFSSILKNEKIKNSVSAFFSKIKFIFEVIKAKTISFFGNEKLNNFFASKLMKRIGLVLVILVALLQIVFGVLIYGFKSEDKATRIVTKVIPFPIAVANQDFITYGDYLHEKDYIHHFYKATEQNTVDFAEIDKQITDQLIENKLIGFQALINKSRVSKKNVDTAVQGIVDQNGGQEKVDKVLSDLYGLDLKQFKVLVKSQMIRDKLDQDLIARATVSHILVRIDKNAPDDKVAEAKTKITGYLNEIKGGLNFAEAAKKYSEDTGSADQGGSLEPFAAGEMVPEFSDAAFATKVGEISEPVRSEFGWHIIKVEKKTGKIQKSFGDWLSNLEKKSLILKFIK
ncbi:MAG: peptidylprolyl isomerase [Patescibacteria group bacterium]|nr:peptidylprolyl isomerase [Patescibacteria group bacterium]